MDLIDREQAISKLEDLIIARRGWLSDGTAEIRGIDAAICELAALPSAEKTGKWIVLHGVLAGDDIYGDMGVCSNCGLHLRDYEWGYCPKCGARMEE